MSVLKGIDVSHHQPHIDWSRVQAFGIRYAFIRATYGTKTDGVYDSHFNQARSAGLHVGAYHYLRFNDRMSAEAQAEAFLETLHDANATSEPMLPPVLDLEDNRYRSRY